MELRLDVIRLHLESLSKKLGRPVRVYLSCPYQVSGTGHNKMWLEIRFQSANIAAMRLARLGCTVFSPISMSHPMSLTQPSTANAHEFWLAQDFEFLDQCDIVVVLDLPGLSDSVGVAAEIKRARENGQEYFTLSMHEVYELEKLEFEKDRKER